MIKKYNVIGDVHGKDVKKYIKEGYINIFVGDYFDPYDAIPFEEMKNNFLYLMDEKMKNPDNIILLYGNHDFHYIVNGERYSRYNNMYANDIRQLFQEFDDLFYGICYNASGRIVSHAGITNLWLKCKGIDNYKSIDSLVESVNNLWFDIPNRYNNFSFAYNGDLYDYYGTSPQQSPLWVRAQTISDLDFDYPQIVGHTRFNDIVEWGDTVGLGQYNWKKYVFVDCLDAIDKTYTFEVEE